MVIKNADYLPVENAIIVPRTNKNQKNVSATQFKKRVDEVRSKLSGYFGGYTSVTAVGGYYSGRLKRLIKEDAVIVWSYGTKAAYKKNRSKLISYCRDLCRRWGQEAIGYIHESDLYYIKKN